MITILEQPNISLTSNPIIFKAKTDAYYTTAPTAERMEVQIGSVALLVNDTITFTFNDGETNQGLSHVITAVSLPNRTGNQVPDDSNFQDLTEAGEAYAEYIALSGLMATYFNISFRVSGDNTVDDETNPGQPSATPELYLQLYPKRSITNFSVTPSSFAVTHTPAVAGVKPNHFKVVAEIIGVTQLEQTPNADSEATFNISNILHHAIEPLPLPLLTTPNPIRMACPTFFVRFAEKWNNQIQLWDNNYTPYYTLRNTGKSNDFDFSNNGTLSHIKRHKKISTQGVEWFYWINSNQNINVKAQVRVTTAAGVSAWTDISNSDTALYPYDVYELPVSFGFLNTHFPTSSETPIVYEVQIVAATGQVLSDIIPYKINYNYHRHFRDIIFLNDLGIWESIETTGIWTKNVQIKKEFSMTILAHNKTQKVQFHTDSEYSHIIRTGLLTHYETSAIWRLFESDHIYYRKENEWIQLLLNTKGLKDTDEKDLKSFELQAVEAVG